MLTTPKKTNEEKRVIMLETLGKVQVAHPEYFHHCPRCGSIQMRENMLHNSLSRRAKVYICNRCGMREAIHDWNGNNQTTEHWKLFEEVEEQWDNSNFNAFDLLPGRNHLGHHCMNGRVTVTTEFQEKYGIESAEDNLRVSIDLEDNELYVSWLAIDCDEEYAFDFQAHPGLADMLIISMEAGCFEEHEEPMHEVLKTYQEELPDADGL